MTQVNRYSRPYARIRGAEPSVTTIIQAMLGKPGLPWAAARETAMYAVHHRREWMSLSPTSAVTRLARHYQGVWDARAVIGTIVHQINLDWIDGRSVNVESRVLEMAQSLRAGRADLDDVVTEVLADCDALAAFWQTWRPKDHLAEAVVRSPGEWVGQCDWIATLGDGSRARIDLKTTGSAGDAIYADSWTLQLSAYEGAREIVMYEGSPTAPAEVATAPNPRCDRFFIIQLRGTPEPRIYDIEVTQESVEHFRSLASAYRYLNDLKRPRRVSSTMEEGAKV